MNKEIEFRGKSQNGQWYYGYLTIDAYGNDFIESLKGTQVYTNKVISESVGQYVGLKDDNENRIYDGDIVQNIKGELLSVEWNDDTCQWQFSNGEPINNGDTYSFYKVVVGNVYDNPKLLSSEQNPERSVATEAPSEPQTPETISHLKQISACFDSILSHQTDDVIEFDPGACLYKIFNTARIGKQLADAVVKNV